MGTRVIYIIYFNNTFLLLFSQLKSVRIGRNNRRIRVEGQDCDDWMAVEMGEDDNSFVRHL